MSTTEKDVVGSSEPDLPSNDDADEAVTGLTLGLLIMGLVLCIFLVSLDMTIIATAIPQITKDFNSIDAIGWYGAAFMLTLTGFSQLWGKAYGHFSMKWVIITAIILFEVGSLICGIAKNSVTLITGRAIAGAGGAGITNGCYTIIGVMAQPEKRPAYAGILACTYGIASVVGPLVGGAFTSLVTWRWCFYINLPIGGFALLVLIAFFKVPAGAVTIKTTYANKLKSMDFGGVLLVILALIFYILPLQWAGIAKSWVSGEVLGFLIASVVVVAIFVAYQIWMGDRAMMVPRLIKQRRVLSLALFNMFMAGSFFIFMYYLPIYFQAIGGTSATGSAVKNLALILSSTVASLVGGALMMPVGYFHVFLLVGSALCLIGGGLLLTLNTHLVVGEYVGYQLLFGIGAGLCFQAPVMVGQAFAKPSDMASTTAILLFFQTLGGAIFISAAQCIFTNRLAEHLLNHALEDGTFVPVSLITTLGAADLRGSLTEAQLEVVLPAYLAGLKSAWSLAAACAGASFASSLLAKFETMKSTIKKKNDDVDTEVVETLNSPPDKSSR